MEVLLWLHNQIQQQILCMSYIISIIIFYSINIVLVVELVVELIVLEVSANLVVLVILEL